VISSRTETKSILKKPVSDESVPEKVSQRKQPESGPFRLQVDRQTKESFLTLEAAEKAGMIIKKGYPIVQVAVYDTVNSINKIIETPES
jgi:hypothetical protein